MKIKEILDFLQTARIPFSFTGDPEREVDRFSSLSHYREGSFTWIKKQENIPLGMDLTGLAQCDPDTGKQARIFFFD